MRVHACDEIIKKITGVDNHLRARVCVRMRVRVRMGCYLTCVCVGAHACVRAWGRPILTGDRPPLMHNVPTSLRGGAFGDTAWINKKV